MSLGRRLRRLTPAKLQVLALALAVLSLVRLALWVVPFGLLRRALARVRKRPARAGDSVPREWISRAVEFTAHWVPYASCLSKALAGYVLLRRFGYDGVLHLGVTGGEAERFRAHAWLECDGRVIIGGGPGEFVPLPPIEMGE